MEPTSDVEIIYLDTNVFIEAYETLGATHERVASLIKLAEAAERLSVVTSRITMAEVLVLPFRDANDGLVARYLLAFASNSIDVREVDTDILLHASLLRADNRRLKLFDAIHIATAHAASATMIVTRDSDFADLRHGPACDRFGKTPVSPLVRTPDDPAFAALLDRHAA